MGGSGRGKKSRVLYYMTAICYGLLAYSCASAGLPTFIGNAPMKAFWWNWVLFAVLVLLIAQTAALVLCVLRINKSAEALIGWNYTDMDLMSLNGYGKMRMAGYSFLSAIVDGTAGFTAGELTDAIRGSRSADGAPLIDFLNARGFGEPVLQEPSGAYRYVKKLYERIEGIVYALFTAALMVLFFPGIVKLVMTLGESGIWRLVLVMLVGILPISLVGFFVFFIINTTADRRVRDMILARCEKESRALEGTAGLLRKYSIRAESAAESGEFRELIEEIVRTDS